MIALSLDACLLMIPTTAALASQMNHCPRQWRRLQWQQLAQYNQVRRGPGRQDSRNVVLRKRGLYCLSDHGGDGG